MPKSLETLLREEVEKRKQKPPETKSRTAKNRTVLIVLLAIAAISIVTSFLNYRTPEPEPTTEPPTADSVQI